VGGGSGIGVSYLPPLSENIVITGAVYGFEPLQNFRDISLIELCSGSLRMSAFRF
jgi:hypothetical protein